MAAQALAKDKIYAEVIHLPTIKPLDAKTILKSAAKTRHVVTAEEAQINGGLGGAVAEVLLEAGIAPTFRRFALSPDFPAGVGSQEYLRKVNALDAPALRGLVLSLVVSSAQANR